MAKLQKKHRWPIVWGNSQIATNVAASCDGVFYSKTGIPELKTALRRLSYACGACLAGALKMLTYRLLGNE
jgi:hypothetical protein